MIKIYDDLIYTEALVEMHYRLTYEQLYGYNNSTHVPFGTKPVHRLFGMNWNDLNEVPYWIMGLYETLKKDITLLSDELYYYVNSVSLNLQIKGQDASFHVDPDFTLMIFPLAIWKKEWGGEFVYGDEYIDYVPGRVIFFQGDVPHRGLSPKISDCARISLVYRLKKTEYPES